MENTNDIKAAQIGKMYVTHVAFTWCDEEHKYNEKTGKTEKAPSYWNIGATLSDKPQRYGNTQTMSIKVEHGVGQKLAECLLPVVIADASKKAQQLADDSKAMLAALGERAITCIADMPVESKKQ